MDFDWTTFLLEIINFLILVWILKHFLYRPVLKVISERRSGIELEMADAKRIKSEAEDVRLRNERELSQWEQEKEAAKADLREELTTERTRLMGELEASVAEARERRRVLDERHQHEHMREVEEQAIAQGAAFVARLLSRLAAPELEARLYDLMLEDLHGLTKEDREAVAGVAAMPGLQIRVQSAFVLDAASRTALEHTLNEVLGKTLPVEYRENPELLAGLQLSIGPWMLHANLRDELKFFSGALRHAG